MSFLSYLIGTMVSQYVYLPFKYSNQKYINRQYKYINLYTNVIMPPI